MNSYFKKASEQFFMCQCIFVQLKVGYNFSIFWHFKDKMRRMSLNMRQSYRLLHSSDLQHHDTSMKGQRERGGQVRRTAAEEPRRKPVEHFRTLNRCPNWRSWRSPAGCRWPGCWSRTDTGTLGRRLLGYWAERSLFQNSPLRPEPT